MCGHTDKCDEAGRRFLRLCKRTNKELHVWRLRPVKLHVCDLLSATADFSCNLLQGLFTHTNSCQASCMNITGNQALSKDINQFLLIIPKFFD